MSLQVSQSSPLGENHEGRALAVFRELAGLSQRATASAGTAEDTAARVLELLTAYCRATRGALLLSPAGDDTSIAAVDRLRVLARSSMSDDEARLLSVRGHASLTGEATADGEIFWVTFPLPLAEPEDAHTSAALGTPATQATPADGHALVVLGWSAEPQARAAANSAHDALALVGPAAAAALTVALLRERVDTAEEKAKQAHAALRETQEDRADWAETFDAVSDPICVVTADYKLVRANAAYKKLVGMADDQAMGIECYSIGRAHHGPCAGCPLPTALSSRRPAFVQQERFLPRGPENKPEHRIYQRWTYPVMNAEGTIDRVVEIIKDVTEQDRLRQAIAQAQALSAADRLKAELLGTVSHELRSPLTTIKGYAATLVRHERHLPREERHEFLQAIAEASDRLEIIIDRILEMSQLETGDIKLERFPVDVPGIARSAIAAAEQRVTHNGHREVTFDLQQLPVTGDPDKPFPLIEADPRRLRQVLDNLIENAVKYSPNGGRVAITLRHVPSEEVVDELGVAGIRDGAARLLAKGRPAQPMVEIVVRDTGVGIPSEHLGRIFDRFHRVDSGLTREVDGLGLGLAISKRLVDLHSGMIWAESTPGQGSVFHVMLPVHDLDLEIEPAGELAVSSEG